MNDYTMNFSKVYETTIDAINNYDKHDIKTWAKTSMDMIDNAVVDNISANVLIQCFPYNVDMNLDDCKITTPIDKSSDEVIAKNYMNAFKQTLVNLATCEDLFCHQSIGEALGNKREPEVESLAWDAD